MLQCCDNYFQTLNFISPYLPELRKKIIHDRYLQKNPFGKCNNV